MTRMRLAAAAILTVGLLAPVAAATSASAAPKACGQAAQVKDHKNNKADAAKDNGKKTGHAKPAFVHAGRVTAVDATVGTLSFVVRGGQTKALRGCTITVLVTVDTKVKRNNDAASLASVVAGDHVNVKGTSARNADGSVTYTAKRISAAGHEAKHENHSNSNKH